MAENMFNDINNNKYDTKRKGIINYTNKSIEIKKTLKNISMIDVEFADRQLLLICQKKYLFFKF